MANFDDIGTGLGMVSGVVLLGLVSVGGISSDIQRADRLEAERVERCEFTTAQLSLIEKALLEPQSTYHTIELNSKKSELRRNLQIDVCSSLKK